MTAVPEARPGNAQTFQPLGGRITVTAVRHLHSGLAALPVSQDDGNASVLYRFRVGTFSVAWFDSAGPVLGLGIVQQGLRDPVDYVEALRAGTL